MKFIKKYWWLIPLIILALLIGGFVFWANDSLGPMPEAVAAMESDEGFTRCQLHAQKMVDMEKSITLVKRSTIAAVVAIVGKIAWEYVAPMFPG